jgi:hypothetical protein
MKMLNALRVQRDHIGSFWRLHRHFGNPLLGTASQDLSRFHAVVAEVHSDPEGLVPVEQFGALMEARGFRTVRWDRKAAGLYVTGVLASERAG